MRTSKKQRRQKPRDISDSVLDRVALAVSRLQYGKGRRFGPWWVRRPYMLCGCISVYRRGMKLPAQLRCVNSTQTHLWSTEDVLSCIRNSLWYLTQVGEWIFHRGKTLRRG